jgi:predicted RNase H-like nuclease
MTEDLFVGIDGCKNGWIFAAVGPERIYRIGFVPSIRRLWQTSKHAALMLIDIPIGLPYKGPRPCDVAARKFLKPKSGSCVFPPPCREALQSGSYEKACAVNVRRVGAKISRQAWGIAPKIREVDEFLRSTPAGQGRVREAHPEVCFTVLAGKPVESSKKTAAGMSERLELLRRHLPDIDAFILHAFIAYRESGAALDDIHDALALAVAARYGSKNPMTLPAEPGKDLEGLPMEIVYFSPDATQDLGNHG